MVKGAHTNKIDKRFLLFEVISSLGGLILLKSQESHHRWQMWIAVIALAILFSFSGAKLGADEWINPVGSWESLELTSTDHAWGPYGPTPRSFGRSGAITYDGKIVYVDRVWTSDPEVAPCSVPPNYDNEIMIELLLRYVEGAPVINSGIYGSVLELGEEDTTCEELWNIWIESLCQYHGKLYAGINCMQGVGYNDYRRLLYVSASRSQGSYTSPPIQFTRLSETKSVVVDALAPGQQHLQKEDAASSGSSTSPTSLRILFRTAKNKEELLDKCFHNILKIEENNHSNHSIRFSPEDTWFQYKVEMTTEDPRLTPVLKRLEFSNNTEILFFDDFNTEGLGGTEYGVVTNLSPGELVLDNIYGATDNRTDLNVSFIEVGQVPNTPPPHWFAELGNPFVSNDYPYGGVISMIPFIQGDVDVLIISVGGYEGPGQATSAGQFVTYDYGTDTFGIFQNNYSDTAEGWWNEGSGFLYPFGDSGMIVNPTVDLKTSPNYEGYHLFYYDDVNDELAWTLGLGALATDKELIIHGEHNYFTYEFNDRLLVSRNAGVWTREFPSTIEGHVATEETDWEDDPLIETTGLPVNKSNMINYNGYLVMPVNEKIGTTVFERMAAYSSIEPGFEDYKILDPFPKGINDGSGYGGSWNMLEYMGRLIAINSRHPDLHLYYTKTVSCEYTCNPISGTVPFQTAMNISVLNHYTEQSRTVEMEIDVTLGNQTIIDNWKSGSTNLSPHESYEQSWAQSIPALGSVIGDNHYLMKVADVTPAPYNQPPYPPSGDTASSECVITATAP